jgi:hypothetical protein
LNRALDFIDNISILKGSPNELVVFENRSDSSAFLELLKLNGRTNSRTLVTLNSNTNVDQFLTQYRDFQGKFFLCLNGNEAGNNTTQKILGELKNKNIKDVRSLYGISENGNQNLNEYLKNKLNLQNKNTNLVESKISENENNAIESGRISNTQHLGSEFSERNSGKPFQNSQSEQNRNNGSGQTVGSNNAGNGFAGTERIDLGNGGRGGRSNDDSQQNDDEKNAGREHSVGRIVSGRTVSDRTRPARRIAEGRSSEISENSTQNLELDILIEKYKGQKLTNEQVAEVVSAACFVSDDNKIFIKEKLKITDDLKEICNQFQSGGTAKQGRGILDEYYTN